MKRDPATHEPVATNVQTVTRDPTVADPQHRDERAQRRGKPSLLGDDPLWYKDAVIYQVHVKSFFDSNNDGVGDFPGLLAKLDYIAGLGVTA
ncbi:MAG TPA: hypothetical protein VIH96_18375, partial [Paraburkholderia sp.]